MQEVALLALARAIDLVGRPAVRQALDVSETSIDLWLLKKAPIPGHVFLALAELLSREGLNNQRGGK